MLLSDPRVVEFLKTRVVPSWEMVREVPKVTIDFGDGHKLERTLKGNTVLYLCNSDGKVLDAFPGVYTPEDFLSIVNASIDKLGGAASESVIAYHAGAIDVSGVFRRFLRTTTSKAMIESPLLKALEIPEPASSGQSLAEGQPSDDPNVRSNAAQWFKFLCRNMHDLSKVPLSPGAVRNLMGIPAQGALSADGAGRMAIELDSRINVAAVRPAIHLWLASLKTLPTPSESKLTLFSELLQVPIDDPYLGLRDNLLPGTPGGR